MKLLLILVSLIVSATAHEVTTRELRCEYHHNPLAIGTTQPRFSWKIQPINSTARDVRQVAYEIQCAHEADGFAQKLLWSSGKITSAATDQIVYAGPSLVPRDRIIWRVRVWEAGGEISAWSEPASFGVGLLVQTDWTALWISARDDHAFTTKENIQNFTHDPKRGQIVLTPAKYFRQVFQAPQIARATLYATALGVYTLEVNGRRVSDERLAPGWSAYQRRIHYQTYDVTKLVREGKNAIGATLADGWYAGYVAYGLLTGQEGLAPESTDVIIMEYRQPSASS